MFAKYGPSKSLTAIHEAHLPHLSSRVPAPLPHVGSDGSTVAVEAHSGYGQLSGAHQGPIYTNQNSPKQLKYDANQPKNHQKRKKETGRNFKEPEGVYENWTAILDFQGTKMEELSLRKGEQVQVISKPKGDYWLGQADNRIGMFPSVYVTQKSSSNTGKFSVQPLEIDKSDLKECEVIGVGGFGRVYRGIWRGEEVALKKVIRELRENEESARERVRREGKLLCLFHNPNIIRLKGVCLQEPSMCLVMEYARGGPLFKVLRGQKLTLNVIIEWAIQIAKGMLYLHEGVQQSFRITPIIHRDLKSHNILIYESLEHGDLVNKTLKITDFGQARQVTQTARMSNAGTYAWAAPESIRNHQFSKYSDVWSYGVVLWEMLTGEVPYDGYEPFRILFAVGSLRRLPIPEKCPKVFKTLLKTCWEEVPEQRPLFREVLSTLEDIIDSPLVTRNMASFQSLQEQWHKEIQEKLEKCRARDEELNERADAINQLLRKQQVQEENLNKREQEFFVRELELFEREITLMIKEQNFDQMQNAIPKKKRWFSVPNLFKKREISQPKDVVHVTEVRKVTTPDNPVPVFKINRPAPGTPLSDVSSPTDASSASPANADHAFLPKLKLVKRNNSPISRNLGPSPSPLSDISSPTDVSSSSPPNVEAVVRSKWNLFKRSKSPIPQKSGKPIWHVPLSTEKEKLSRNVAVSIPRSKSIDDLIETKPRQVKLPQPSLLNPAAVDTPSPLVISRKPTIDFDPRKIEEILYQRSGISNETTRQDTHARRPSTLGVVSITTSNNMSGSSTLNSLSPRTASQSVYQWGDMNYTIDTAPDKTTVRIGSTPTSPIQNSFGPNAFSFQNSSVNPPSSTLSAARALDVASVPSSQTIDARTSAVESSLANIGRRRIQLEQDRAIQQHHGTQLQTWF